MNAHGIISWVSTAGTVGGAVYDPATKDWEYTTFSSNSGNEMDNDNGVIAYLSSAGTIGAAAYDFSGHSWDYTTFSSNSNNTGLTIEDGTVRWTNNNGSQKAGYTSGGSWSTGSNTALQCRFFASDVANSNYNITYFWCLSIGAADYSYDTDAGHTISRRWGWKQYANGGDYSPGLTISNSNSNSGCGSQVSFSTGINEITQNRISVYPSPANSELTIDSKGLILSHITITDATGKVVLQNELQAGLNKVDVHSLSTGVYFLQATTIAGALATTRFIKE